MQASVLAGDIGGTKTRVALLGDDLAILDVVRVGTPRHRADLVDAVLGVARDLVARRPRGVAPPSAAAFGVAGVVAPDRRRVVAASNLPIAGPPLAAELETGLEVPTTLSNDGWASALGEFHRGAAAGRDPLLALFLGTGVGMGLVVDGRPYAGAGHCAGEAGHAFYRAGRRCGCGRDGCFEAYMGGRFLGEKAVEFLGPDPSAPAGRRSGADLLGALDRPEVAVVVEEAAAAAETMVANLVHVLSPGAVVLGGGIIDGWPDLLTRIERHCRERCAAAVTDNLVFVGSRSGGDAVLWGAARLAFDLVGRTPARAMDPRR